MPAVRRLLRITFNALTVMSVVCSVAVLVACIASYARNLWLWADTSPASLTIICENGFLWVNLQYHPGSQSPSEISGRVDPPSSIRHKADTWLNRRGFWCKKAPTPEATAAQATWWNLNVGIPPWFAIAMLLTLPLIRWCRQFFRLRRARIGACSSCGYDLRATPDRCPECGAAKAA
jgi:hypothetical protein